MKRPSVLVVIPARGSSKRIPHKNARHFAGKPLITRTIEQALRIPFADRVIVDTDSPLIAALAKKAGASVPFLRPQRLARDTSLVADSVIHLLKRLKNDEGYAPHYVLLLQTTSPLREMSDIEACWSLMKQGSATTVLTVAPTHPRLYHLRKDRTIELSNKTARASTNIQAWPRGFVLNGCFVYIVRTNALLKEGQIITKRTKAFICPRWRSVDLDTPEDWVMAEFVFRNRNKIERAIKRFK